MPLRYTVTEIALAEYDEVVVVKRKVTATAAEATAGTVGVVLVIVITGDTLGLRVSWGHCFGRSQLYIGL